MTKAVAFKQSDVTRLLKGAVKAGYAQEAIKLTVAPDGALSLTLKNPADNDDDPGEDWSEDDV